MTMVISSSMQKNWISGCKILTKRNNTNPNSQYHIPVVVNNSGTDSDHDSRPWILMELLPRQF